MKNNNGVALILVVSILAVAGVMAISFAFTMRLELKASANYLERVRASYLAESGISHARSILKEDSSEIDSFEDNWHTVFSGGDVDNDADGENDSRWLYIYDEKGESVGRYAVLVRDVTSLLDINIADKHNISPLKATEGWTSHEIGLQKFLSAVPLENPQKVYEDILTFRYGPDNEPGEAGVDDNFNQRVLGSDGIDNNSDGIIDEAGEGIDEPMEFGPGNIHGDDNAFETPYEILKVKSIKKRDFKNIYPYITSYSVDKNVDVKGRLKNNLNFMDAGSLAVLLEEAGVSDPFQKAVNIADACDNDFSQSVITKLYNALPSINKGPVGNWLWENGYYKSRGKGGEPLEFTWMNLPEGEYYIGVFGLENEMVGDVTVNGITQSSVKHGEILRFGAVSFENRMLSLRITNREDSAVCYYSRIELYPRLGQENFSSVEVRGVEGIRINEIMCKPVVRMDSFSGQAPGGDWALQGNYYENSEPNSGKAGKGTWVWNNIPDGGYYVKLFAVSEGQYVGDVEINGMSVDDVLHGDLFGGGKVIIVSKGKLTIEIQNNLLAGSVYFKSVELKQEPDAEYIEIVNLTPREVNIGGWSVGGPSIDGWPASIPLGTVIGSHQCLALCVDKYDSQSGIEGNGLSFMSLWGNENSAELHFLRGIKPSMDLISNDVQPNGNFIVLKDSMGHIVDKVEYLPGSVSDKKSLERGDPAYMADSNYNGIFDGWYTSKAKAGGTPGLQNDNDGMEDVIEKEVVLHDITEVNVKNNVFSSVGEIASVSSGTKEWGHMPIELVSKIADRLTVFGIRLEAEGNEAADSNGGWKFVQRATPWTDYFESGEKDAAGIWKWDRKDGVKDGYYSLKIFGSEGESIAASVHLANDTWTDFTPPLTPGPDGSILFGSIEIGTESKVSIPSGVLELKIKNVSETGGAHFNFIRLDPVNTIDGRINLNTASQKVLSALPGLDEDISGNIINNRVYGNKNGLWLGIGDLLLTSALGSDDAGKIERFRQISNLVTVRSDVYRIIVTAQILEKGKVLSEKKIWAVYER